MNYIKKLKEVGLKDLAQVGGKNASLGEMISALSKENIRIPQGFAVTAEGYWHFIESNNLLDKMKTALSALKDVTDINQLQSVGKTVRELIKKGKMPEDLSTQIKKAYNDLSAEYKQQEIDVAIRSSATAEDLPTASFAGQQETFLNIRGGSQVVHYCQECMASLFTDRAIIYRIEKGFDHFQVALSVGVQKMVRSDLASAGVAFSLDTESGFDKVIIINSAYGLGESLVKGLVSPDEFVVFKPTLEKGFDPIIRKKVGQKKEKMIYTDNPQAPTKTVSVEKDKQSRFSLDDKEVIELSKAVAVIENYYSAQKKRWSPMDVEWAQDGVDGKLYIVQARPETVHATKKGDVLVQYQLIKPVKDELEKRTVLFGQAIGQQIVSGKVCIINSIDDADKLNKGDILVTGMTDPDWVPLMKKAAAIITDRGGRTCHAAIVSRELGISALVGTQSATELLKNGQVITMDCSRGISGVVYEGAVPFELVKTKIKNIPEVPVDIMVNCADPTRAFSLSFLPVTGVGLARIEFIINNEIQIHPMALVDTERVKNKDIRKKIEQLTVAYPSKKDFFIQKLAEGIGMIAAGFYEKPVIVRLSDFKTNEYRNLIGGEFFEPQEENPMLGFRGASRYYNAEYKEAFELECAAFKYAREKMGFSNIRIMIPFVRTVVEAEYVLRKMEEYGLKRGENGLEVVMMVEVPSNVLLIDQFSRFFDGFSIGSNDLTQLTLGVDRDSHMVASLFDERDVAVKIMMVTAIEGAHRNKRYIGICGQAPSDFPELIDFFIQKKIDSISLNPDAVLPFFLRYTK